MDMTPLKNINMYTIFSYYKYELGNETLKMSLFVIQNMS